MQPSHSRRCARLRTLAVLALLPPALLAQTPADPARLDPVTITADPLDRTDLELQRPASVLRGDALRLREATTLGDTLGREPGVQSSAYGPGAGRPIIRGMDSARVRIAESGLGVADVSGASPDHRVAADTLNARQVEILRGPATLLYGSGAIGGLVNIVSERVPLRRAEAFGAQATVRASSAERERAGALDADVPLGSAAALRLEGFAQRTRDYALAAPLRDAAGAIVAADRLPNSATDTRSGSFGGAWFGSAGTRLGAAVQRYQSDYGIPNAAEPVVIGLRRTRWELHGDTAAPGPFSALRTRAAFTDYAHTEFEPDGTAGARFTNRGTELRAELPHPELRGWRGVLGVQLTQMRTRGAGEGQLPRTQARSAALFAVEERRAGALRIELGARVEHERMAVDEDYEDGSRAPSRAFSLATASAGVGWDIAPGWDAGLTLTSAQRAPAVEELYFVGAHPATFAFEIGNPRLQRERALNLDLRLRRTAGAWRAQATLFANRVRDYVYGFFDGSTTDLLDADGNVEETLSTLVFTQADAHFTGGEAEVALGARTGPQARLWGDWVRARLASGPDDGASLPRMSPARAGLDLGWRSERASVQLALLRVQRQARVAAFDLRDGAPEAPTAGYTRVDLGAAWRLLPTLTLYAQGRNLTDADIRVHTSFLKNQAPPPGRSLLLGLRATL